MLEYLNKIITIFIYENNKSDSLKYRAKQMKDLFLIQGFDELFNQIYFSIEQKQQ